MTSSSLPGFGLFGLVLLAGSHLALYSVHFWICGNDTSSYWRVFTEGALALMFILVYATRRQKSHTLNPKSVTSERDLDNSKAKSPHLEPSLPLE